MNLFTIFMRVLESLQRLRDVKQTQPISVESPSSRLTASPLYLLTAAAFGLFWIS